MDTTTKAAAPRQHLTKQQWISRSAFCFGNVGHSAFYGVMSNYFIIFVTSGMFAGLSKSVADRLIGLITGLEGPAGWFAFAAIVTVLALLSALAVCLGTKENDNIIRQSAKQKTSIKDVFSAIFHNDQIMWPALAYLMYSCAYVITNGVLFYLYKFVIGQPDHFWVVGVIATIVGFFVSPLFPIFNKYVPRKWLFTIGQCCMVAAYLIFIFGRSNVYVMDLGLVLFNVNCAQLVTVLTLTDAIEYGQLKTGQRNEAVVLAVRPMIDKLTGAISNGLVGWIALACGMTGRATAADMTAKSIRTFDSMAFYIPMVLALLSIVIFLSKVTLSEKKHAQVVEELKTELAAGNDAEETVFDENQAAVTLLAPVDGEVVDLANVTNEDGTKGFPGSGFAIKPADGRIYAPFDGKIRFAFSTRHAFEIEAENGVGLVIHVGIGTVNMRGEGFNTHFQEGQTVHADELLLEFNRDLILQSGYDDIVVTFLTQPQKVQLQELETGVKVVHGQPIAKAEIKK